MVKMQLCRKTKFLLLKRPLRRAFYLLAFVTIVCLLQNYIKMVTELSEINNVARVHFASYKENVVKRPKNYYHDVSTAFTKDNKDSMKKSCLTVQKFDRYGNANISTYDLPEMTDYTLQSDRNYRFTVENESVAYKENLTHLDIFIVPFSHVDPGYGMTFEQYYRLHVKGILDSMVQKLTQYPDMKFQWAEAVFLERWWRDINVNTKMQIRKLIREGRLEIVTGGWVMPDEAITSAEGIVDQLIEGHLWVQDKLGATPVTAWSNDPFGYSGVIPYLLKSSGIQNMVILRVHQAIKATLAKMGALEFKWRPYMKADYESDILCHVMPYTGYWIGDVCGRNKTLCKEYAFMHTAGDKLPVWINEQNVAERARLLYEQYRITADLYKFNTLYIGLGEDFSYSKAEDWDLIYSNFERLMKYMNNRIDWKVSIKFGILSDYFRTTKHNEEKSSSAKFPILSGDFFPYSDWDNDYWTGFYTTRPFQKYFAREIERIIKVADVFLVFLFTRYANQTNPDYKSFHEKLGLGLRGSRRILNTFLHHDGITGTSVQEVTSQYDFALYQAYTQSMNILKQLVTVIITPESTSTVKDTLEHVTFRQSRDSLPKKIPLVSTKTRSKLFIVNPLLRQRDEIVTFQAVSHRIRLTDSTGIKLKPQVSRCLGSLENDGKERYDVSFRLQLAPYSIESIKYALGPVNHVLEYKDTKEMNEDTIVIQNDIFSAAFNARTGTIEYLIDNEDRKTKVEATFMWYETIKSGAYVSKPIAKAKPIPLDLNKAVIKYLHGEMLSEVRVLYSEGIFQSYKIYNTTSVKGYGLHITTKIDIRSYSSFWSNKEVILRFHTDIINKGHFYTDQNGLTLIGRKIENSIPIGGNYYPITKMVTLEDNKKRLTVHTKQSHGVASLREGWIEIMLDRTMITDDHKGLGQGIMDNKPTRSDFVIQVEYKDNEFDRKEERYTLDTKLSTLINEDLQHPILLLYDKTAETNADSKFVDYFRPIKESLPCDISIIALRNLVTEEMEYKGTSLILYRKLFHCGLNSPVCSSIYDGTNTLTLESVFRKDEVDTAHETSLTHLHRKRTINISENLCPTQNEIKSYLLKLK